MEYVRTVFSPEFWPNSLEVDYSFKHMVGKPKEENLAYDQVEFQNNLIIHGCHQAIGVEYNRKLTKILKKKVEDIYKYLIYYNPLFNSFDEQIPYTVKLPNISRKRS